HVLEEPRLDEPDLPAAALFGGRADHVDAPLGELIPDGGEGGARSRPRGGDDVVTAGIADARERVVLAQDGHRRSLARLDGGAEGGVDPTHALLDLEALLAQEL